MYRVFIIRIIGVLLLSGPSTAFRWRSTSLGMTERVTGDDGNGDGDGGGGQGVTP